MRSPRNSEEGSSPIATSILIVGSTVNPLATSNIVWPPQALPDKNQMLNLGFGVHITYRCNNGFSTWHILFHKLPRSSTVPVEEFRFEACLFKIEHQLIHSTIAVSTWGFVSNLISRRIRSRT